MSDTGTEVIVVPGSGEVIDPSDTTDVLAQWIDDLRDVRRKLSATIDALGDELTSRLDMDARRSANVGGWRIETKAPTVTDYPPEALHEVLSRLVAEGHLLQDVLARTVYPPPMRDWKVDRRVVNVLLKHENPVVVEAVRACAVESSQKRSVSVRRVA